MSAWYLFAMLGLYPLRMGAPEYVIGSPAFPRAEIDLGNRRKLLVIARNNSARNVYVQSLTLNGKPWNKAWLRHQDIADGATLEFVMGATPSRWGSGANALPPSLTAPGSAPRGLEDVASHAAAVSLEGQPKAAALIDDDATTALPLPAGASVDLRLATPLRATHYTLTSADAALSGVAWTLEGRNGDGAWTVLDQRRAQRFAWARQLRPFRIARPGAYSAYRLRLDAGENVALAEIELLQPVTRRAAP
jgi:hypothetical protein